MGHGHVTPNADGSKARCGGPGFCSICNAEREAVRRQTQGQADWQLVKDSRLVELIRSYVQENSDIPTRGDHAGVPDSNARIPHRLGEVNACLLPCERGLI